ncbi:MAG TPA: hypothetical protein VFI22_03140 [Thermomicrobiales bacterium]|nr:hypothetical protein [Thermomicrobiales bacterium]
MDRVASELLPPLLLEERRRQARRDGLLAAAAGPGPGAQAAAHVGCWLVRLGHGLERRATRPVAAPPPNVMREACECAL